MRKKILLLPEKLKRYRKEWIELKEESKLYEEKWKVYFLI
jgi:hypothetical protein